MSSCSELADDDIKVASIYDYDHDYVSNLLPSNGHPFLISL